MKIASEVVVLAIVFAGCGGSQFSDTGSQIDGGTGGASAGAGGASAGAGGASAGAGGASAGAGGASAGAGGASAGAGGALAGAGGALAGAGGAAGAAGATTPQCDPVPAADGMTLHVNPIAGDDAGATGSGTRGGSANPACAFGSITRAAAAAATAGRLRMTILVDVTATANVASGETFPIVVPASTTITSATGATLTVQVASGDALRMPNDGSQLRGFIVDGQGSGSNGIVVSGGSQAAPNVLSRMEVMGFTGSGVRADNGALGITAATNLHGNGAAGDAPGSAGLTALGSSIVTVDGVGATVEKPTQFSANAGRGIDVRGAAQVNITGTLSTTTPGAGTVLVKGNTQAGVYIEQQLVAAGAAGPAAMTITGVVVTHNGTFGMRVFGGSGVKVRGSYLSGNTIHGVSVETDPGFLSGGGAANDGNAIERLDFGQVTDFGHNVLQDATNPNGRKGVCVSLTGGGGTGGLIKLAGNAFASNGVGVDCSQTAGSLPATSDCDAQGPLGDIGRNPRNDLNVAQCTVP